MSELDVEGLFTKFKKISDFFFNLALGPGLPSNGSLGFSNM